MSRGRLLENWPRQFWETEEILTRLENRVGIQWPVITRCLASAERTLDKVEGSVADFDSGDTSIVVFGSLARGEWTSRSDLDWTLLIDGETDFRHLRAIKEITAAVGEYRPPGATGVFGSKAFGHDLLHLIGGEADTNKNITQRVLLLLESKLVGRSEAYSRVVRQVLMRYLANGGSTPDASPKVPRFLLNDVVRFWRTMAVDFVFKKQERGGEKWALRNAKLRMSRKLIFVAGLLMCLTCDPTLIRRFSSKNALERLEKCVRVTPLGIVAEALLVFETPEGTIRQMVGSYEGFLALLEDPDKREALARLPEEEKDSDPVFQEVRELGHQFQAALQAFFFEQDRNLSRLIKKYGVF